MLQHQLDFGGYISLGNDKLCCKVLGVQNLGARAPLWNTQISGAPTRMMTAVLWDVCLFCVLAMANLHPSLSTKGHISITSLSGI